MTAFQRRQRLLSLLGEQPGVRVTDLARLLGVSEGTIRNDLTALEELGRVTRVRGGAILNQEHLFLSRAFEERAQAHGEQKRRIARRAADMLHDGAIIILDSSTTVYQLVPFLANFRDLTVITNGIDVAVTVATTAHHRVTLLGGDVHPDGLSVSGMLSDTNLTGLRADLAFLSASGFSLVNGPTELDDHEASVKRAMIAAADRTVALLDASKFERSDPAVIASLDQISEIITDDDIHSDHLEHLRQAGMRVTLCGDSLVSILSPSSPDLPRYRLGFANLSEHESPFAVEVRQGLELAAASAGDIELVLADNRLDAATAIDNAEQLIASGVDLAIEYQIDEKAGNLIMERFRAADIPVIAVDIPLVGATFFGVENFRAGQMAGAALGHWVNLHWGGEIDRLIVLEENRAGSLPGARIRGQIDGFQTIAGPVTASKMVTLDSGNTSTVTESQLSATLEHLPDEHRLAVVCFNDDAAIGAIGAARHAGREQDIVVVGQGMDRRARAEIRDPASRLIGSTAYWPAQYGEKLLDVATKILQGEQVPPAVYIDHVFIDGENINDHYPAPKPEGLHGDGWDRKAKRMIAEKRG